jgi:glucosamine 6-phosphate synthetase-like amidotransferase/phosphosugar isomerase protein
MCGIAGSFNRESAYRLYQSNLERGRYSVGLHIVYGRKDGVVSHTLKREKPLALADVPAGGVQYLFHSRAPTSNTTEFNIDETHPFEAIDVLVAHNGIITNVDDLRKKFIITPALPNYVNVDSYVIPWMIHKIHHTDKVTWIEAICKALTQIDGTFGLWIHVTDINTTFVCRSGSTLYGNYTTGAFTSCKTIGFDLLKEGVLYETSTDKGLFEVATFAVKPIYFFA